MRLLLATNHLGLGGSESYLLTVAEQLDRLGHEVALYAPELGGGAEVARERGLTLIDGAGLSEDFDAAVVQDGGVSYQLADRCPAVPQLFVAHSAKFDLQAPPQLPGMVTTAVALNERIAERLRRYAADLEVVRLHQPIDTERFAPRTPLPEVPRRVLLLSNTPNADRLGMLETVCDELGLELSRLGGLLGQEADIRPALEDADIVIGYGRSILEAMSCGRAAYVYDWRGGDGWMTPRSYPEIEASGIAGRTGGAVVDADRLREDLRGYSAEMGPVNHDLVIARHRANVHAEALVGLLQGLGEPPPRPTAPLQEMARLVRLEWRARVDAHSLANENAHLRGLLGESEQRAEEAREAAAETGRAYERTLSWRLTRPLRALGQMLPRRRRRSASDGPARDRVR